MERNNRIPLPNNVIKIESGSDDFFVKWFEFLRPITNLTGRETELLAAIAQERYEMSMKVSDDGLLDSIVLNNRKKIKEKCGMRF